MPPEGTTLTQGPAGHEGDHLAMHMLHCCHGVHTVRPKVIMEPVLVGR